MKNPILKVQNLKKYFPQKAGVFSKIKGYTKAVDGIDFHIQKGETLGLVGESGCGKTTTGRCVIRLIEPTEGSIQFMDVDLLRLSKEELRKFRKNMQIVFQDPFSSFNPRMTVGNIIAEPLRVHKRIPKNDVEDRVKELMEEVGLDPAFSDRYPHQFSGGQRQRIGIARAIALNPALIVADEPVSSLDVSVQAQIMNLFCDLREKHDLTYLFISHNLSIIRFISDRIAVMYFGKIVEIADSEKIFGNPRHPYTKELLNAVPDSKPSERKDINEQIKENNNEQGKGATLNAEDKETGCSYYEKCNISGKECREIEQTLKEVYGETGHYTSCNRHGDV